MDNLKWLWAQWNNLTWWQMTLWVMYTIYFIIRCFKYWDRSQDGLIKGYKYVIFGYDNEVKIYHILLIIFDIPPAILGLTFPFLKRILTFKIYTFKDKKKGL